VCIASEYGNFIGNSEKERIELKVKSKTYSIWKIFQQKNYKNPLYEGLIIILFIFIYYLSLAPIPQPAWPLGPSDLWRDYWCRYQNHKNNESTTSIQVQAVQEGINYYFTNESYYMSHTV